MKEKEKIKENKRKERRKDGLLFQSFFILHKLKLDNKTKQQQSMKGYKTKEKQKRNKTETKFCKDNM